MSKEIDIKLIELARWVIREHMTHFCDIDGGDMQAKLEMSTAEIGLTVRTTNCLEERGIFTVRDLLHSTPDQLLSIANFGEKTLEEVYKSLEKFGFYRASRRPAMAA